MELILLTLVSAALAAPVAPMSEDGCRVLEQTDMSLWPLDNDTGLRALRQVGDLDGDGGDDLLVVTGGSGSGASHRDVRVEMSSGEIYEVGVTFPFDAMMRRIPVPAPLAAAPEAVREAVELALFNRVCEAPEGSLERLQRPGAEIRWVEGAPALPENYAVLDGKGEDAAWISYLGWVHRMERKSRPMLRTEGRVGDLELLSTAHGVLLWDAEEQRHAWLYVFAGEAGHKLRWESIRLVDVRDHTVTVKVGKLVGEMQSTRIDLERLGGMPDLMER